MMQTYNNEIFDCVYQYYAKIHYQNMYATYCLGSKKAVYNISEDTLKSFDNSNVLC